MSWFSNLLHKWTLKKAYKWGRGLAKTKLRVFYTLRERNLDLPLEDIYYLTILNRIGYTEATADMIIKGAEPLSLRSVVHRFVIHEAMKTFGPRGIPPRDYGGLAARRAVDDIIPADL